jgi:hypothetical protein
VGGIAKALRPRCDGQARNPCFPSSFTVLACGPFSPISSAKVTREPRYQLGEGVVEHTVAMKIDLAAVGGF